MDRQTSCWKCNSAYAIHALRCPHCSAVNANHSPDTALKERDCGATNILPGNAAITLIDLGETVIAAIDEDLMQQAMQEQEEMALDALRRCAAAGSDPKDLDVLAALLGLAGEWERRRFQRKPRGA